jgi:hypothetical protein
LALLKKNILKKQKIIFEDNCSPNWSVFETNTGFFKLISFALFEENIPTLQIYRKMILEYFFVGKLNRVSAN